MTRDGRVLARCSREGLRIVIPNMTLFLIVAGVVTYLAIENHHPSLVALGSGVIALGALIRTWRWLYIGCAVPYNLAFRSNAALWIERGDLIFFGPAFMRLPLADIESIDRADWIGGGRPRTNLRLLRRDGRIETIACVFLSEPPETVMADLTQLVGRVPRLL